MIIEPYDFQKAAIESIFTYFTKNKTGNPLIAMPTGTGKSVVIAAFLYEVMSKYPGQRIMVLTHRKELIEQDYLELMGMWPTAPAGIYSAGLNRKDIHHPIVFCGIGSVYKKAPAFGKIDLVLIDEAHLVSPRQETMYQAFLTDLTKANSYLRVIGLSATYWRLGHGLLTENHIFTDICFNMTDIKSFNWLLDQGYLSPLIPLRTNLQIDISGVGIQAGEYKLKELQDAVDKEEITYRALEEIVETHEDRKHWLLFTTGIEHTEHVAGMLNDVFSIPTVAIHSKLSNEERDTRIRDYKAGKYVCAVNNNVLTTGFNFKPIDLIGVLRHTQSSALWVQILGRGTRTAEGKRNCLVYDFADNTGRLGPINDPVIPPAPGSKKKTGTAPVKVCPNCNTYNHSSVRACIVCNYEFPQNVGFTDRASTKELIKRTEDAPEIMEFVVKHITYNIHHKLDRSDSLKVTYYCGIGVAIFTEYMGFGATGFVLRKAQRWWLARVKNSTVEQPTGSGYPYPVTAQEALTNIKLTAEPQMIKVWVNKKYPEIVSYKFNEEWVSIN